MKTATTRATEAIEAAQMMYADEMGASLDLSPAARMALIETIAAAIRTAVAEEQQNLEPTDEEVRPPRPAEPRDREQPASPITAFGRCVPSRQTADAEFG